MTIKRFAAFLAAAVMGICTLSSCGDSDENKSKFASKGLDSPEAVIDAFWDAYKSQDASKVTALCSEKEFNYLCEQYNVDKKNQIETMENSIKSEFENLKDTYTKYAPDEWVVVYGEKTDGSDIYFEQGYDTIGLKSAFMFADTMLKNEASGDTITFITPTIPVIELEDGWYYCMA